MALLSAGCASTPQGILFRPVQDAPAGVALIYVYRPDDGKGTEFEVACNGTIIGTLPKAGYIPIFMPPGKVEFVASVKFKLFQTGALDPAFAGSSECVFTAEAGKTYYVEGIADEAEGQRLRLAPAASRYALLRIANCRLQPQEKNIK